MSHLLAIQPDGRLGVYNDTIQVVAPGSEDDCFCCSGGEEPPTPDPCCEFFSGANVCNCFRTDASLLSAAVAYSATLNAYNYATCVTNFAPGCDGTLGDGERYENLSDTAGGSGVLAYGGTTPPGANRCSSVANSETDTESRTYDVYPSFSCWTTASSTTRDYDYEFTRAYNLSHVAAAGCATNVPRFILTVALEVIDIAVVVEFVVTNGVVTSVDYEIERSGLANLGTPTFSYMLNKTDRCSFSISWTLEYDETNNINLVPECGARRDWGGSASGSFSIVGFSACPDCTC